MIDIVDIVDIVDITPDILYNEYIIKNKPVYIKNFIDDNCLIKLLDESKKKNRIENIANIKAYYSNFKNLCSNSYFNFLESNKNIIINKDLRFWKHDKDNLTPWHYDGNGVDNFNISLQGQKTFYLCEPNYLPVYPLSNVSYHMDFQEQYKIELKPTDMLYIPSYWFHKVITNMDNTININYLFFKKEQNNDPDDRNCKLYQLHKMFNTNICKEFPICQINNKCNKYTSFLYGFYEMIPIYIIYLVFYIFIDKYFNQYKKNILLINIIILIFILNYKKLHIDYFGVTKFYTSYLLFLSSILYFV